MSNKNSEGWRAITYSHKKRVCFIHAMKQTLFLFFPDGLLLATTHPKRGVYCYTKKEILPAELLKKSHFSNEAAFDV